MSVYLSAEKNNEELNIKDSQEPLALGMVPGRHKRMEITDDTIIFKAKHLSFIFVNKNVCLNKSEKLFSELCK